MPDQTLAEMLRKRREAIEERDRLRTAARALIEATVILNRWDEAHGWVVNSERDALSGDVNAAWDDLRAALGWDHNTPALAAPRAEPCPDHTLPMESCPRCRPAWRTAMGGAPRAEPCPDDRCHGLSRCPRHMAHDDDAAPTLDVDLLARATAAVSGYATATGVPAADYHRAWAERVAREYEKLAEAPQAAPTLDVGPDLVFSTSPAPEGIDTDCVFLVSADRISVHISRRAINAQVARLAEAPTPEPVICGARHPSRAATCRRNAGHDGDHGTARLDVTWEATTPEEER